MKNLHLLPTNKPSRLYIGDNGNFVFGITRTSIQSRNDDFTNQDIYITSDEEIRIDDYYLGDDNHIYCLVSKVNCNGKKIILTTDQELIAEGVQPIDDEFLQWFMNNPSCEEIFLTYEYEQFNQDNPILKGSTNVFRKYKIIIPKEKCNGSFKDCFKPLNECTCDTIGKKQTAMQNLKYDLLASLESSSQALEEIEDGIVRQACQMVVKNTLDAIIKRVDGELLEMEKEQIIDAKNDKLYPIIVGGRQYYNETYGGTKK